VDAGDDAMTAALVHEVIVCVDCGGPAYLLSKPDEEGRFWPGDVVAYRCRDCLDRWDLVVPDGDDDA
jgi:hypothetical protein